MIKLKAEIEKEIEELRKLINDEYHLSQNFNNPNSSTYPDRMRSQYYKEVTINAIRRFVDILDFKLKSRIEGK